ncbi:MAG: NapC/NirT family cytochrome c [Proteobacteria bacterium]|nr:NapC/NirT family cytochrome c [Pseudomonadota bacterium]
MFREMWVALRNFIHDFFGAALRGARRNRKGLLVFLAVAFVGVVFLGVVVLKATASPAFCASCHNMDVYIESWRESTHSQVGCMDCHFEPGLWGTLWGKWRAQAHVVMKITGTAPSRPHTQISDASCLRQGCHSTEDLSQTDLTFKGVKFSHGNHLGELRRGNKLRCVTCHSQIVQGEHLTVTESTCFTCHFVNQEEDPVLSDCQTCHVQTKAKIFIDANENLPFVHKEYLDRGVLCGQCHFDVVFGDGHLKDNICVQCHAEPKILMGEYPSADIHRNHVTLHKVECYRCHSVIDHGIVRPTDPHLEGVSPVSRSDRLIGSKGLTGYHYDTNCVKCHSFDQHEAKRLMYMGTGATEVADVPSPMYLAHADCGSCHIALTKTPTGTQETLRLNYDEVIKSCSDCHGAGYDDMAKHWRKILTEEITKAEDGLLEARREVSRNRTAERAATASQMLDVGEKNLAFVRNGRGLHNMDYALKVLGDVRDRAEKAKALVLPKYVARAITSPTGCTQLCHSCVECIETTPVPFGNVQFPHDIHVQDEGLACLECHTPRERHGQTLLKNCNECHHGSGAGAVECQDCHVDNHNLYNGQNACDELSCDVRGEKNPMADGVTCQECHTEVADGKVTTLEGIKATCVECHDDSYGPMVDQWKEQVAQLPIEELRGLLKETQGMVLRAIREGKYTYDAQDLVNNAEKNLKLFEKGNPIHNPAFSKDLLDRVRVLLNQARKTLQTHTTVRTLPKEQYL